MNVKISMTFNLTFVFKKVFVFFWQYHRLVSLPQDGLWYSQKQNIVALEVSKADLDTFMQQRVSQKSQKPNYHLSLHNEGLNHLHYHETFYDFKCTK